MLDTRAARGVSRKGQTCLHDCTNNGVSPGGQEGAALHEEDRQGQYFRSGDFTKTCAAQADRRTAESLWQQTGDGAHGEDRSTDVARRQGGGGRTPKAG